MKSNAFRFLAALCAATSLSAFAAAPQPLTPGVESPVQDIPSLMRTHRDALGAGRVRTNSVTTGTAGDVILDASQTGLTSVGVLLRSTTGAPNISAQLSSATGAQFNVIDSSRNLLMYVDTSVVRLYKELSVIHLNSAASAISIQQGTQTNMDILNVYGGGNGSVPLVRIANSDGTNYAAFAYLSRQTSSTSSVPDQRIRLSASGGYPTFFKDTVAIGKDTVGSGVTLDVSGTLHADTITSTNGITAVYQDLAEWVPASEPVDAGTVVVVSPNATNEVSPSTRAYQTSVAGVVSDKPGVLLGKGGDDKAKIATTGRVKVKVDASHGAIRPGDLLVTSDKRGVAMKSQPVSVGGMEIHRPGTLVGKALEPLAGGEGEILVLLSLQ